MEICTIKSNVILLLYGYSNKKTYTKKKIDWVLQFSYSLLHFNIYKKV